MTTKRGLSRRQVLRYGMGAAGAAALAPFGPASVYAAPAAPQGGGPPGERLIPPGKMGTITFTQRDVPGNLDPTKMRRAMFIGAASGCRVLRAISSMRLVGVP